MAKKYSCKNCGAELYFDPKRGKLHCEFCDSDYDPSEYAFTPEEASGEDAVILQNSDTADDPIEQAKAAEGSEATDDSLTNKDLVVYQCPNCGAEVITAKETIGTTCVYCNHAITLSGNVKGEFCPNYVLPFTIERKQVTDAYRKLCKRSWLTPKLFLEESTIEKIKGLYVPYWLYSFDGRVDLVLNGRAVRVYRSGDNEITETSNYDIRESGASKFQMIPADALKELDNVMMDSIEPFDFAKLVPFEPAYLAGFYTQRWDETSTENENRAKERAQKTLSARAKSNAGSYTTLTVRNQEFSWNSERTEYAMLPVWMMYTEYKGKKYLFGMNGQTGKLVGEIPKDYGKLAKVVVLVVLLSQLVMMAIRMLEVLL